MALTMKILQEQINELRLDNASLKNEIELLKCNSKSGIKRNLKIGDDFKISDVTFTILDITEQGYVCLGDCVINDAVFDNKENSDWKTSSLREWLNNEFYKKIADEIGVENIVEFERDLTALDGLKGYGSCTDKISLISVDEYRNYRELIPNTESYWWFTLTADSNKSNHDNTFIRVVSPSGNVCNYYYFNHNGVRPFCIFSSSIFESEDE